jgi:hypothetical protein
VVITLSVGMAARGGRETLLAARHGAIAFTVAADTPAFAPLPRRSRQSLRSQLLGLLEQFYLASTTCSRPLLAADAAANKLAPLRADNLLINRLLQTIQACLRYAELHLILSLLALGGLRGGATSVALAR